MLRYESLAHTISSFFENVRDGGQAGRYAKLDPYFFGYNASAQRIAYIKPKCELVALLSGANHENGPSHLAEDVAKQTKS